jgi:tRNA 5-methylaminomethyl-2-thiouridine biosynthesis bifunctional protein
MSLSLTPDAVIIGGGLAGSCTAYALAKRGLTVHIVEAAPSVLSKASGNRFGLVTPHLSSKRSPTEALYSKGFEYTERLLATLDELRIFHRCGALHLPTTRRLEALALDDAPLQGSTRIRRVSPDEGSEIAGVAIKTCAFHIPAAGYVSPRDLIAALLAPLSHRVTTRVNNPVTELSKATGGWRVAGSGFSISTSTVVICGAYESALLPAASWLPLEPIRGQTVCVAESSTSQRLRSVLCFGGYLTPSTSGEHFVGAHYRHGDTEDAPRESDTQEIVATCKRWLPALDIDSGAVRSARVCFRTSTIDRLPYVGALPDFHEMKQEASQYQPGTNLVAKVPVRCMPGLFINAGHGSRGLISCPLAGEILARLIYGDAHDDCEEVATLCAATRVPHRIL